MGSDRFTLRWDQLMQPCAKCGVTWIVNWETTPATNYHSPHDDLCPVNSGPTLTFIIHTDGACRDNGEAGARGGIGVYFGPNSRYNQSKALDMPAPHTNQKAELSAILSAVQLLRSNFVPTRANLVASNPYVEQFRVVLATDSDYAVKSICEWWHGWHLDAERNVLLNSKHQVIQNSQLFLAINDELRRLPQLGIEVQFWHVPRESNQGADRLARMGAQLSLG